MGTKKQLSNPFSTGGGGTHFEAHVQASFVTLMLTGGFAPCLPAKKINKIKLQGKFAGFNTDDLIVFTKGHDDSDGSKMLGQIKHSISITKSDTNFRDVINAAWKDYNDQELFNKNRDVISLITGPLSKTDINNVRTILEWARFSESSEEFFEKVYKAKFSSKAKQRKLEVFEKGLEKANNGKVSDKEVFKFLKHFFLLGYDLDIRIGVIHSFLHSLIGQYSPDDVRSIWARLVNLVQNVNKNAGTITKKKIPDEILKKFKEHHVETIPQELVKPDLSEISKSDRSQTKLQALAIAALLGKWDENFDSDKKAVERLINEL